MIARVTGAREEQTIAEVRRVSQAGLDATKLLQRVARALRRVIPFDYYSATTIDPVSSLITNGFAEQLGFGEEKPRPVNPAWFDRFYFEEGYEQTLSLARRRQWATTVIEETGGHPELSLCYRESMRPAGVGHKLHAVFVDRNLWGDIELYREFGSPGFSRQEIELVQRIAPNVGSGLRFAALRAAGDVTETDQSTPGVVVIDERGEVTFTAAAGSLLSDLHGQDAPWRESDGLPVSVQVVLGALRQTLAPGGAGGDLVPRLQVRGRSGRWLSLHASGSEAVEGHPLKRFVVISPAQSQEVMWLGMSAYDLSPREEEVVKLVVGGLSTKKISDQLFIAEHTVQRHLSNIFEKVGVRGRRALVKHLFVEQMIPNMN